MKILLAEDDSSIQLIARVALARVGGHDVTVVKNGVEALAELTKTKPDLIILDVMMPLLDGFETCTQIKNSESLKEIPVIFLTAKAQTHEQHHGMSLGAIGYILKPFDPMTLHLQIEELLKTHAKAA